MKSLLELSMACRRRRHDRSQLLPLRYGAVVLAAPVDRTAGLEGHYFTDRNTRGELSFRRHFKRAVETHAAGRQFVESADG